MNADTRGSEPLASMNSGSGTALGISFAPRLQPGDRYADTLGSRFNGFDSLRRVNRWKRLPVL
jgi:hypothetical protein